MRHIEMSSILTCPKCGYIKSEEMPTERHQRFYACKNCNLVIMPKHGSCCVFCSYGNIPCPSAQKKRPQDDSVVYTLSLTKRMRIQI